MNEWMSNDDEVRWRTFSAEKLCRSSVTRVLYPSMSAVARIEKENTKLAQDKQ